MALPIIGMASRLHGVSISSRLCGGVTHRAPSAPLSLEKNTKVLSSSPLASKWSTTRPISLSITDTMAAYTCRSVERLYRCCKHMYLHLASADSSLVVAEILPVLGIPGIDHRESFHLESQLRSWHSRAPRHSTDIIRNQSGLLQSF